MSYPKSYNKLSATSFTSGTSSLQKLEVSGALQFSGVQVASPVSNDSVCVSGQGVIVAPKSTLSSLTLCMPNNPSHGQVLYLSFTQCVKHISYKSTISFANKSQLTCAEAGDNITLIYDSNFNKWFKLSGSGCSCAVSPCCEPSSDSTPAPAPAPAGDADVAPASDSS